MYTIIINKNTTIYLDIAIHDCLQLVQFNNNQSYASELATYIAI